MYDCFVPPPDTPPSFPRGSSMAARLRGASYGTTTSRPVHRSPVPPPPFIQRFDSPLSCDLRVRLFPDVLPGSFTPDFLAVARTICLTAFVGLIFLGQLQLFFWGRHPLLGKSRAPSATWRSSLRCFGSPRSNFGSFRFLHSPLLPLRFDEDLVSCTRPPYCPQTPPAQMSAVTLITGLRYNFDTPVSWKVLT